MKQRTIVTSLAAMLLMIFSAGVMASADTIPGEAEPATEFVVSIPAVPFVGIPLQEDGVSLEQSDRSKTFYDTVETPELYTFQFDQTPIILALKVIANQTGKNIVAHSNVTGHVTLSLKDVTLDQALDIIARTQGLVYELDGNVYIFTPADVLPGNQRVVQRAFRLQNAPTDAVQDVLSRLSSQVLYTVDPLTRTVVLRGPAAEVDEMINLLQTLDKPQRQVMLMTSILEITKEEASRMGLNPSANPNQPHLEEPGIQFSILDGILDIFSAPINALGTTFEIQERLDAMKTNQNANLLAMPSLATLNGREASIFLGDQVPIVEPPDENGSRNASWKDIGIKLTYTPWISDSNYVTFDISVSVEAIDQWVDGVYPSTVSREVDTVIRAENGQPIVIGGLFRNNEVHETRKLAILGDLPILGPLFQHHTTQNVESEIVVVLVPYIY